MAQISAYLTCRLSHLPLSSGSLFSRKGLAPLRNGDASNQVEEELVSWPLQKDFLFERFGTLSISLARRAELDLADIYPNGINSYERVANRDSTTARPTRWESY
jgi:hypothetical protein